MNLESSIRARVGDLTAAERRVATALLADFPFAGLLTLVELSERSRASAQTILRLVTKLGFRGYGEFQRALIGELKAGYHSPLTLHDAADPPDGAGSVLGDLTEATVGAVRSTMASIPEHQFMAICALVAERQRSIYLLGGRMTHSIAVFLGRHLRQIRPKVHVVSEYEEDWPEYLLGMGRRDVILIFDYRRYQPSLERFAERATRERGARVVLLTDRWLSPVSKHSTHTLPAAVDVGTPWDTSLPLLLIAEAIVNVVAEADWSATAKRIARWDELRSSGDQAVHDNRASPEATHPRG